MGLFSQQPEQDDEWAGIPSEPVTPESTAERLTDAAPAESAWIGVLGAGVSGAGAGAGVESIVIPVAPVIEIAESQDSGEGGGTG
jgi:hypothetical protein